MSTRSQLEHKVQQEFQNAPLRVHWVRGLHGRAADRTLETIELAEPVPVRVLPTPRAELLQWSEEWLDPWWHVEPLFPNPVFAAYQRRATLYAQATSYQLGGKEEVNDVLVDYTPTSEQAQAARAANALTVYVPRAETGAHREIRTGSAIVGRPNGSGFVLCDFEGNLYGAENLHDYTERMLHAASRQLVRYPTVARRAIPVGDLIEVGRYDYETRCFTPISDRAAQAALGAWLNPPKANSRTASGPGL